MQGRGRYCTVEEIFLCFFFDVACMNDVGVCVLSGASGEMVGSDPSVVET